LSLPLFAPDKVAGSKVIESIGSALTKGGLKRGEKVLLNFVYPSAWIISVPTSTGNGESGTVCVLL